tara:strand:+ start:98 stop:217 length:120 start_codon:yes stop_codon:yes gene_type:complete
MGIKKIIKFILAMIGLVLLGLVAALFIASLLSILLIAFA